MSVNRNFKGVWIPKEIWLDKNLTWMEKLFIPEINSLDNDDGCYASNSYFADFFQLSNGRVSQIISSLVNKGYVSVEYIRDGKEIKKRILRILNTGIKNTKGGYLENDKENNTLINNTINCGNEIDSKKTESNEDGKENFENEEKTEVVKMFIPEDDVQSVKQKPPEKKPERVLMHRYIRQYFKTYNQKYYHSAKEAKNINNLLARVDHKPEELIKILNRYRIIRSLDGRDFWSDSPLTPSAVVGRWDHILAYNRKEHFSGNEELRIVELEKFPKNFAEWLDDQENI